MDNLLLANENVPLPAVCDLREAGYDIDSISERCAGIPDEEVLKLARLENRIIITFDRDYGELIYHRKLQAPAGLIHLRFAPAYPEEPSHVLRHLFGQDQIKWITKYTVIERGWTLRQRPLPN